LDKSPAYPEKLPWQPPPASEPGAKPKLGEPCPQPTTNRTQLINAIAQNFSKEELEELCADVQQELEDRGTNEQVNLEMVGGSGKTAIVRNLSAFLERRDQLGCLEAGVRFSFGVRGSHQRIRGFSRSLSSHDQTA
jgi:hypothetical protein